MARYGRFPRCSSRGEIGLAVAESQSRGPIVADRDDHATVRTERGPPHAITAPGAVPTAGLRWSRPKARRRLAEAGRHHKPAVRAKLGVDDWSVLEPNERVLSTLLQDRAQRRRCISSRPESP